MRPPPGVEPPPPVFIPPPVEPASTGLSAAGFSGNSPPRQRPLCRPRPPVRSGLPDREDLARKFLEEVRSKAMEYTDNLPNFICTQITQRYLRRLPKRGWVRLDNFVAELTFYDKQEHYKLVSVGNRSAASHATLESLRGTTSTGEFGSSLNYLFDPATRTLFRFEGIDHSRGSPRVRAGFSGAQGKPPREVSFSGTGRRSWAWSRLTGDDSGLIRSRCSSSRSKSRPIEFPRPFPLAAPRVPPSTIWWRSRDSGTGFRSRRRFLLEKSYGKSPHQECHPIQAVPQVWQRSEVSWPTDGPACNSPRVAAFLVGNPRRRVAGTGSKSRMSRLFIYMDGQDGQDYLARGFTVLSSTIVHASTRIPKNPLPSSWITSKRTPGH